MVNYLYKPCVGKCLELPDRWKAHFDSLMPYLRYKLYSWGRYAVAAFKAHMVKFLSCCGWCPLFFFFLLISHFSAYNFCTQTLSVTSPGLSPQLHKCVRPPSCSLQWQIVFLSWDSWFCSLTCQLTFPNLFLTPSLLLWLPWPPSTLPTRSDVDD